MLEYRDITKDQLLDTAREIMDQGGRLANAVCNDAGETLEVIYIFQINLDLINLRVHVAKDEDITSLSSLQLSAALIENEMKEFFGLQITDIALDFKCRMILGEKSPRTPMLKELPATQ